MEEPDPTAEEFSETLRTAAEAVNKPPKRHSDERIAELRRLYESGEYKAGIKEIVAKLIDEHLL